MNRPVDKVAGQLGFAMLLTDAVKRHLKGRLVPIETRYARNPG